VVAKGRSFIVYIVIDAWKVAGGRPERIRVAPHERVGFMERLQAQIARMFGVAPAELRGGSRRRAVVVRAALGLIAVRVCGLPTAEVARVS
jgi:hypothetical protein